MLLRSEICQQIDSLHLLLGENSLDPILADRLNLAHSWGSTTDAAASWAAGALHAEARHDSRGHEACPSEPEECSAGLCLATSTLLVAGATDDVVGRDVGLSIPSVGTSICFEMCGLTWLLQLCT